MPRWLRKTGRVMRWIFIGSAVLALALAAAIQLPPVRSFIRDQVVGAIKGSLKGELELADVRWPIPQQLELSGVSLRDRHGTRVAALSTLMAHVRYRSLLAGQVELDRLELSDAYIDFADFGDEHGLLSVFASDEPKKPEKPAADSGMSPIPIVVRELCIERGEVRLAPSADQAFRVRKLNGCVRLRVAQHLQVAIEALEAEALRNDALVAQIVKSEKLAAAGKGADKARPMQVGLEGRLAVGKDMPFDARVHVRNFNPETLRVLGVSSDVLRGAADLDLHAAQSKKRLSYRAQLHSAAGELLAHGELDSQQTLWLHLETGALAPAAITSLDLPKLGLALDAEVGMAEPGKQTVRAQLVRGYYGTWPLPVVNATVLHEQSGRMVIQGVEVKQAHAELSGSGELAADGGMQASLRLSVPDLSELPPLQAAGVSGGVNADVSLKRFADALLDVRADVHAHQVRTATQRVEDVQLNARVSGHMERPLVKLDMKADQVILGSRTIGEAILNVNGGPDRYQLSLDADQRFLRADGWAQPLAGGWNAGLVASLDVDKGPITLQLPLVRFVPSDSVEITQLRALFQKAELFVDGKLDLRKQGSKLRLAADVPDVAMLMQALGQNPLPGHAELVGSVRGQMEKPEVDLRLRYMKGPRVAGHASEVALGVWASPERGRARVDLQASAGAAHVSGRVDSRWAERLPLSAAVKAARHELTLDLRDVSLAELMDPGSPAPQRVFNGVLNGHVGARGNLSKIEMQTHLESRVRMARDPQSTDVVVDASYKDAAFKLQVLGGDRRGELLNLRASVHVPLERQLAQPRPPMELVRALPWELSMELSERSLRELPMLASADIDADLEPVRFGMHANIGHAPYAEPSGIFEAGLRWAPLGILRNARATCNDRASGQLLLAAKWAEQKLGVELHGGPRNAESIRVSARAPMPFDQVLQGQVRDLSGVQLLAQLHKLELSSVPWLCDQGSGQISLTAKASAPLTPRAEVSFDTETHGLQWQDSPPVDLQLAAHSQPQSVSVSGQIATGGGTFHMTGTLPVDVRAPSASRMVDRSRPLQLDTQLVRMPMAALLAPVSAVARVSGTTSGQIHLRGSVAQPDVKGSLTLDDVSMTLPRLSQRFAHVHLKAMIDGKTIRLSEGKVRDLDGTATLAALVTLRALDSWRAELNLNARNFPLRKSGVMMGRTDVDAKVEADMTPDRTNVDVALKNVSVDLTTSEIADVQSLEPNPEFTFIDSRLGATKPKEVADKEQDQKDKDAAPPDPLNPTNIHVVTTEPLWVRRDDFAVNMSTDISVTLGGKTPLLKGKIDLVRGYISLLGQSFDIKRGRVVLSGAERVDPQLEITAEHDTPSGTRVRVEVKGFVNAPELAFFVNDQATTAGEALLAISGRNDRSSSGGSPEQQIASAAIGMTTGLLSLGARREFGDWIPMLSIEQGNQTRVRVGIEADRFIPNFMRGFVKGAYVEGIVASGGNNSSSDQAAAAQGGGSGGGVVASSQGAGATISSGTGVLLELNLPKNFVWAGQYGPGQAWSIDLDWRP